MLGQEESREDELWRECVCQTSSSVYPPTLPQCEPLIGERPSSFCPSFCMASSLAFLSAHVAGPFALFPKLSAVVGIRVHVSVCMLACALARVCGCVSACACVCVVVLLAVRIY